MHRIPTFFFFLVYKFAKSPDSIGNFEIFSVIFIGSPCSGTANATDRGAEDWDAYVLESTF